MAGPASLQYCSQSGNDNETDYGSELDISPEEESRLFTRPGFVQIEDNPILLAATEEEQEEEEQQEKQIGQDVESASLRLPRMVVGSPLSQAVRDAERIAQQLNDAVASRQRYPNLSARIKGEVVEKEPHTLESQVEGGASSLDASHAGPDTRSPLERFRTHPKKTLSVTDLVSPAYCELQYWYVLSLHGKKKRTPAMRQGSKVHKTLEQQVYTTVRVDVQTKEDAWGLRIWNVIQGLRTLRTTGLTRELEVWGTIDGLVVNGVIDEVTYICPDVALEESKGTKMKHSPSDQPTLADYFKTMNKGTLEQAASKIDHGGSARKIYLCDVKTRSSQSLPSGPTLRPTKFQLMLYHHLLSNLASNSVDFSILTERYRLDPTKLFSDALIAKVGSLNTEAHYDAQASHSSGEDSLSQWSQDSMDTLLANNNLSLLWTLMVAEFQQTLPHGVDSLGNVLKAEYRSQVAGEIMGTRCFLMDQEALNAYLEHEMKWWRGKRPPEGVCIEEAYKCRSCEFAERCEWRLAKVDEVVEKSRLARERRRSAV